MTFVGVELGGQMRDVDEDLPVARRLDVFELSVADVLVPLSQELQLEVVAVELARLT